MQSTLSIEYVTPQQAQEWLLANGTNRPHRIDHVHYLASEMREGRFTNTAEIHLFDDGTTKHVANGQHTMMAIVEHGKPVQVTVRRSSGTPDECRMVRTVGHDKGKARTTHDSLVFYDVASSCQIGKGFINKIGTAIRFAMGNFGDNPGGKVRVSDLYVVQTIPLWEEEFFLMRDATMPCSHDMHNSLTRSDALSLILLTFHYQPEKAKEFWGGVASGANLEEGDPRLKTISYLMQSKYSSRTRTRSEKGHVTSRKLIYTWNKFFNGELMFRGINTQNIDWRAPVCIYGTHYTGKQPSTMWPDKRPVAVRQ